MPPEVDVEAIRRKLGMSPAQLARSFGFALDAVQSRGGVAWAGVARALFKVIEREPDAVRRASAA